MKRILVGIRKYWSKILVRIVVFDIIFILIYFAFSTWKYQQLINEGSRILDLHCLNVNPLIIARKNSFIKSIKILETTGNNDYYWIETENYLDLSRQYIDAENEWLNTQGEFMDRSDYDRFLPEFTKKAAKLQYNATAEDLESAKATVELISVYEINPFFDLQPISDKISNAIKKSNDLNREYDILMNQPSKEFDLRRYLVSFPRSKCPDENYYIPDVLKELSPSSAPANPDSYNS